MTNSPNDRSEYIQNVKYDFVGKHLASDNGNTFTETAFDNVGGGRCETDSNVAKCLTT